VGVGHEVEHRIDKFVRVNLQSEESGHLASAFPFG
jgi:hypothetical protein